MTKAQDTAHAAMMGDIYFMPAPAAIVTAPADDLGFYVLLDEVEKLRELVASLRLANDEMQEVNRGLHQAHPYRYIGRDGKAVLARELEDQIEAMQDQLAAMTVERDAAVARVKHVKRGTTYRVIGAAKLQTDRPLSDYAELTVYQCETDGMIWVRPVDEFEDGRFEVIIAEGTPTPAHCRISSKARSESGAQSNAWPRESRCRSR